MREWVPAAIGQQAWEGGEMPGGELPAMAVTQGYRSFWLFKRRQMNGFECEASPFFIISN